MLTNININKMNQLTSENETAKQIVSQLLENHQTIVSMISHEIRNPLTLVSSALQIIEIQHPEVINFHGWSQAIEDIEFMCNLLNELSDFNNGSTLHHSVFSLEKLLKNIAVSFAMSLDSINSNIEFTSKISLNSDNYTGDKIKFEEVILNINRIAFFIIQRSILFRSFCKCSGKSLRQSPHRFRSQRDFIHQHVIRI